MKKICVSGIVLAFGGVLLMGCGRLESQTVEGEIRQPATVEETDGKETSLSALEAETTKNKDENNRRMVMLDDKIYVDTGEISCMTRCGVMDFGFDSSVKSGEPKKNHQTNFGSGYEGQYGMRDNRIEIFVDDAWHIFACHENDFEGVTMTVEENTNHSIKFAVHSETDSNVHFGKEYSLEVYHEEISTWESVPTKNTDIAFEDIAYIVEKGKTTTVCEDWTDLYGKLDSGKYRIVKKVMDFHKTGDYTVHTLSVEFEI